MDHNSINIERVLTTRISAVKRRDSGRGVRSPNTCCSIYPPPLKSAASRLSRTQVLEGWKRTRDSSRVKSFIYLRRTAFTRSSDLDSLATTRGRGAAGTRYPVLQQARLPALSPAETASKLVRLSTECEASSGEHLWVGFGNTIREGSFRIGFEETPEVEILAAVLSV